MTDAHNQSQLSTLPVAARFVVASNGVPELFRLRERLAHSFHSVCDVRAAARGNITALLVPRTCESRRGLGSPGVFPERSPDRESLAGLGIYPHSGRYSIVTHLVQTCRSL